MTSSELRDSFLKFFEQKKHTIVSSASLMPTSPNLLFTNAGMNQFVPYFLEEMVAPYSRATDTQKCIRAGGKHNDLDDVGFDTYHHTFFEMLGNWSFGDYFKKEAIQWSWELLTKVWGLPKERLYATVYKPADGDPSDFDQEAYDFWKEIFEAEGMSPEKHIVFGNKKDNFWMMGETGPCGPCSELHIDLTPDGLTEGKLVNADDPYCIEIWNLVFIQFNATPEGTFEPLPNQHVDTGMGFERVAGIFATTKNLTDFSEAPSNYNSDLFTDLFAYLTKLSGHQYQRTLPSSVDNMSELEMKDCIFRILADHIRTLSFSIGDGILPGNNGRNYVLRRILRRAVMYGQRLGLPQGFFTELFEPLKVKMSSVFPELEDKQEMIRKVLQSEEESFHRTLQKGLQMFEKRSAESKSLSGKDMFELYDTHGFPVDLIEILAGEQGVTLDKEGFTAHMEEQRQRSRDSHENTTIRVSEQTEGVATEFVGYQADDISEISAELKEVIVEKDATFLVFDRTPFYAEMGGQVGDSGQAIFEEGTVDILDTKKDPSGRFLHKVKNAPQLAVGSTAFLSVDTERRLKISSHHTATHILQWALREVLGTHIAQAGSLVTEEYLRFDFTHFQAMTAEEIAKVEQLVSELIIRNDVLDTFECAFADKPDDVLALFGEKYGNEVRVVDIGGYSKELCGGTHVRATGEIGLFTITQESAIAAGTRRLEAVVGHTAIARQLELKALATKLSKTLTVPTSEVLNRVDQLISEKSALEKELRAYKQKESANLAKTLVEKATEIDGVTWVREVISVENPGELRPLASQVLGVLKDGVVVLAARVNGKVSVVCMSSDAAQAQGIQAGAVIRSLTQTLGGKGGGKPDLAMGGAPDSPELAAIIKECTATV